MFVFSIFLLFRSIVELNFSSSESSRAVRIDSKETNGNGSTETESFHNGKSEKSSGVVPPESKHSNHHGSGRSSQSKKPRNFSFRSSSFSHAERPFFASRRSSDGLQRHDRAADSNSSSISHRNEIVHSTSNFRLGDHSDSRHRASARSRLASKNQSVSLSSLIAI